jgi:hypothetical protein
VAPNKAPKTKNVGSAFASFADETGFGVAEKYRGPDLASLNCHVRDIAGLPLWNRDDETALLEHWRQKSRIGALRDRLIIAIKGKALIKKH